MEFRELKSLVTIYEYGSFTKAAEKLYISQPAISVHIKSLENELKFKIFKRSTKGINLTAKGYELYEFAVRVLAVEESFLKKVNIDDDNFLKIGASSIPSAYLLPEIIKNFKEKNETVRFNITQGDSRDIINLLNEDIIDVGFIGMECDNKNIVSKSFYKDEMVIITPNIKEFRDLKDDMRDIKKIFEMPFVMREEGSGTKDKVEKMLDSIKIDIEKLNIMARVKNQETIINMVKNEIAVSIVSRKSVEIDENNKSILVFHLPKKTSERNLNIIYSNKKNKKKVLKNFIDFVDDYYN